MIDAAAVSAELEKVFSMIATAHRLLGEDRIFDLQALDRHIEKICAAVGNLAAPDAQALKPGLERLMSDLDGLSTALNERFGDLPIMPSHSVSTAAAAYADMLKHFP
jgi:hypothetical protein